MGRSGEAAKLIASCLARWATTSDSRSVLPCEIEEETLANCARIAVPLNTRNQDPLSHRWNALSRDLGGPSPFSVRPCAPFAEYWLTLTQVLGHHGRRSARTQHLHRLVAGSPQKVRASRSPPQQFLTPFCRIRRVRPELRIIISSATIDAQSFVDFFNSQPPTSAVASSGITAADELLPPPTKKSRWDKQEKVPKSEAVMVRLEGRVYPVEIAYLEEPTADVVLKVVETVFDIHLQVRSSREQGEDFTLILRHRSNRQATFWSS